MSERSDPGPFSIRQPKWVLVTAIVGSALLASLALEFAAASGGNSDLRVLIWAFIGAVLFNAISLVVRWIFTRDRRRRFLLGQIPFAIGLTKLAALLMMAILVVFLIVGLTVGAPFR